MPAAPHAADPLAHSSEARVGGSLLLEALPTAGPRDLVVDLVGHRVGRGGDGDDQIDAEVSPVGQEGRGQQEPFAFHHRAEEQHEVPVPHQLVFEHPTAP
jgi:hypothetical protein